MPASSQPVIPAFFKHNLENERDRRTVTRSSAVYYFARRENFRTQLVFMNYWREKRAIQVTMRLTLRTMEGEVVYRQSQPIERIGGHVIEFDDILDTLTLALTEGSVELEFTSDENMAIAYPAAVIRYLGDGWHTVAHASQRYLSVDSGDDPEAVGQIQQAHEGNLTIQAEAELEPFVIVHNGPVAIDASPISFEVHAESGRLMIGESAPMAWAPYQTRLIKLGDFVDFRPFLAGERGTYWLKMLIGGVFPRMIGGNALNGEWSVDHTNFAATDGPAATDVIPSSTIEGFKDLVFNLPNNVVDGWECYADIYPTYPGDDYQIDIRVLDKDGSAIDARAVAVSKAPGQTFPRITVDNDAIAAGGNVELLFRHARELPRRFHTGIHYRVGGGNPGFLTDGPLPHSTAGIRTRWFPVFEPETSRNMLLIANRTAGDECPEPITFALRLFNSHGDEPISATLELAGCESRAIAVETLFDGFELYLRGAPGWVYMSANRPQRSVLHYASEKGGRSVAVCHAF